MGDRYDLILNLHIVAAFPAAGPAIASTHPPERVGMNETEGP
jgi:hypothetical protein